MGGNPHKGAEERQTRDCGGKKKKLVMYLSCALEEKGKKGASFREYVTCTTRRPPHIHRKQDMKKERGLTYENAKNGPELFACIFRNRPDNPW